MRTAGAKGWPPLDACRCATAIGKLFAGDAAPMRNAGASLRKTAAGVLVVRGGGTGMVVFGGGAGCEARISERAAVAMAYWPTMANGAVRRSGQTAPSLRYSRCTAASRC